MTWEEVLKIHCGTHKVDDEKAKALVGNQKE